MGSDGVVGGSLRRGEDNGKAKTGLILGMECNKFCKQLHEILESEYEDTSDAPRRNALRPHEAGYMIWEATPPLPKCWGHKIWRVEVLCI